MSSLPVHESDVRVGEHTTVLVGASNGKYPDGNSVVVRGSEGVVVIDPSLTVHARGGVGVAVDRVLVSHAHEDHMSGIGAVGAAHVHAHHDDVDGVRSMDGLMTVYGLGGDDSAWRDTVATEFNFAGWPHATGFADGDVFDVGGATVSVMHLPGHTRGHSAFIIEPDGVAFVGDIDLSSFGPYYGDHWSDLDDFVASIARVRDLDARHYVTFHHKGIVAGRVEFVRQLDAFASVIQQRSDRLVAMVGQPRTLTELVDEGIVYRAGSRPPMFGTAVELRTITMHLAALVADGAIVEDGGTFLAA